MMNLNISWVQPSPVPTCGYRLQYRRNTDPSYSEIDLSGNTAAIGISAPACFEGIVQSDCCSNSVSDGIPFGANAYQGIDVTVEISGTTAIGTASTPFVNSYDLLVSVTIYFHIGVVSGSTNAQGTYPAGSIYYQVFEKGVAANTVIDRISVYNIAPIFNNGGQLQQLDTVNTPPYIGTYWDDNISGGTWDGSPASLPSFTLNGFVVTEQDTDGNPTAGNLLVSYILDQVFDNAFSTINLDVYDGLIHIGSLTTSKTPLGLRNDVIGLIKGTNPLDSTTQFTMVATWPDTTEIRSYSFFFPSS